jgi:hypothetical protein
MDSDPEFTSSPVREDFDDSIHLTYTEDAKQIELTNLDIQPFAQSIQNPRNHTSVLSKRNRRRSQAEIKALFRFRDKNNKEPKKEYLRCKVIRAFKRAVREALAGKTPKTKLHQVMKEFPASVDAWNRFAMQCRMERNGIAGSAQTESGPNTDGKAKRKTEANSKSFSDSFCREFFSNSTVANLYGAFIEVVFSVMKCEVMIKRFGEEMPTAHNARKKCCGEKCQESWEILKGYLMVDMIKDLETKEVEYEPTS